MLRFVWPIAAVSCSFIIGGCSDNDDRFYGPGSGRPQITGTLELRWSIEGSTEPEACAAIEAADFETQVSDGFAVSELEADCAEFVAPMTLYIGDYVARSRLVSADDATVTHRVVLDRLRIVEDEVTVLRIDFPSEFVVEPGQEEEEVDAGVPPVDERDAEAPPGEDEVDAGGDAATPPEPEDAGTP